MRFGGKSETREIVRVVCFSIPGDRARLATTEKQFNHRGQNEKKTVVKDGTEPDDVDYLWWELLYLRSSHVLLSLIRSKVNSLSVNKQCVILADLENVSIDGVSS